MLRYVVLIPVVPEKGCDSHGWPRTIVIQKAYSRIPGESSRQGLSLLQGAARNRQRMADTEGAALSAENGALSTKGQVPAWS